MHARALLAAALFPLLAPSAARAQTVFFEEKFSAGIPTSWANIHLGSSPDVWLSSSGQVDGTPCVYHEYFCNSGTHFRDNILRSPAIDLSGLSQATFTCAQVQGFAGSIFYNKIEVTTNGGQSYTVIKDLAGSPNGYSDVTADISAFAGLPDVRVALHYKGFVANNWWVDNVRVLTTNPVLRIRHLVAGSTAHIDVHGAVPGATIAIGLSSGGGPISTPYGPINLSVPIMRLPLLQADPNGDAFYDLAVPAGSGGSTLHGHAVVFAPGGSFDRSNSFAELVQ
jgi:hypothetical protein